MTIDNNRDSGSSDEHETMSESEEEIEKVDEESLQKPKVVKKNPFFQKNSVSSSDESEEISEDSEDDDSDSEDEDEGDDVKKFGEMGSDDEDPLIAALKKSKEKPERDSPPDIRVSKRDITDISFHPSNNLISLALIDGEMTLFEFNKEENKLRKKLHIHKKTVRSLGFGLDGRHLYSGCNNSHLKMTDVETGQVTWKSPKCHNSPLYKVKPMSEHLLGTGDEDGTVKLWDNRQKGGGYGQVMESKQFDEFVSDIYYNPEVDDRLMVVTSGEGTLQSYNVKGKRPDIQSEVYEGEFSSGDVVHRNSKFVVGCGDGRLYMFNWGQFGYHSAEFPGHPDGINALVAVTDNVIVTGCEDGIVRAVHLYPHRFIGSVGQHEHNFPVEKLDVSAEGDLVASISHDQRVKFWNIGYFESMDYFKTRKPYKQPKGNFKVRRKGFKMQQARELEHQLPSSKRSNRSDFFKGIQD